jgi:hypothetical protein
MYYACCCSPGYPATPLDTVLVGQAHLDVYATHTVVAFAPDGLTVPNTTAYFFTAIAFATAWKHNPIDLNYTLKIDELASLVDSAVPVPSWQPSAFEDPLTRVPREAFLGAGEQAVYSTRWVWFRTDFTTSAANTGTVSLHDLGASGVVLPLVQEKGSMVASGPFYQISVAPVWQVQQDCVTLLGEAGKVTAISAYRFASVNLFGKQLRVVIRGGSGERVPVMFGHNRGCVAGDAHWATSLVRVTIESNGTANATFEY